MKQFLYGLFVISCATALMALQCPQTPLTPAEAAQACIAGGGKSVQKKASAAAADWQNVCGANASVLVGTDKEIATCDCTGAGANKCWDGRSCTVPTGPAAKCADFKSDGAKCGALKNTDGTSSCFFASDNGKTDCINFPKTCKERNAVDPALKGVVCAFLGISYGCGIDDAGNCVRVKECLISAKVPVSPTPSTRITCDDYKNSQCTESSDKYFGTYFCTPSDDVPTNKCKNKTADEITYLNKSLDLDSDNRCNSTSNNKDQFNCKSRTLNESWANICIWDSPGE